MNEGFDPPDVHDFGEQLVDAEVVKDGHLIGTASDDLHLQGELGLPVRAREVGRCDTDTAYTDSAAGRAS